MSDLSDLSILIDLSTDLRFWYSLEIPPVFELMLREELKELIERNYQELNTSGIFYCRSLDFYIYSYILSQENQSLMICSVHKITDAIPCYFNRQLIDNHLLEFISFNIIDGSEQEIRDKLQAWSILFKNYVFELVPDMGNESYDDHLVEFLKSYFGDNLSLIFYAITLEIPILITQLTNNQISEFKTNILKFLPILRIEETIGSNPLANLYLLSSNLHNIDFKPYVRIDGITRQIDSEQVSSEYTILNPIFKNILFFHEDRIMPIELSVMTQIFWNIQKVYGIFALSEGKVNFEDYIEPEDIGQKFILNELYTKMTLIAGNVERVQ